MVEMLLFCVGVVMAIHMLCEPPKPKPDWQEEGMRALREWEQSDVKRRFDRIQATFDLSVYIGRKVGHVTRAGMILDGGRWYVHTCCHGWVEVSALLQGQVKKPAWVL